MSKCLAKSLTQICRWPEGVMPYGRWTQKRNPRIAVDQSTSMINSMRNDRLFDVPETDEQGVEHDVDRERNERKLNDAIEQVTSFHPQLPPASQALTTRVVNASDFNIHICANSYTYLMFAMHADAVSSVSYTFFLYARQFSLNSVQPLPL